MGFNISFSQVRWLWTTHFYTNYSGPITTAHNPKLCGKFIFQYIQVYGNYFFLSKLYFRFQRYHIFLIYLFLRTCQYNDYTDHGLTVPKAPAPSCRIVWNLKEATVSSWNLILSNRSFTSLWSSCTNPLLLLLWPILELDVVRWIGVKLSSCL